MELIFQILYNLKFIQKISTVKTIKEILNKRIFKKDSLKNKLKTINYLKRKGFNFEDINVIIKCY